MFRKRRTPGRTAMPTRKVHLNLMAIAGLYPRPCSIGRGVQGTSTEPCFEVGASRTSTPQLLDCACFNAAIVRALHRVLGDRQIATANGRAIGHWGPEIPVQIKGDVLEQEADHPKLAISRDEVGCLDWAKPGCEDDVRPCSASLHSAGHVPQHQRGQYVPQQQQRTYMWSFCPYNGGTGRG
jgi:hypothetical protein